MRPHFSGQRSERCLSVEASVAIAKVSRPHLLPQQRQNNRSAADLRGLPSFLFILGTLWFPDSRSHDAESHGGRLPVQVTHGSLACVWRWEEEVAEEGEGGKQ